MALKAMTTADTVEYVSDLDPAKVYDEPPAADGAKPIERTFTVGPGATTFKLRPLDVFLNGYIYDNASQLSRKEGDESVGIHTRINQTNIEAVRHGLAGFTNFTDAKGGDVKFETQKAVVNGRPYEVVNDAVMNKLGLRLIQELAAKIKEISEVSKAEEKNSAGA
jgi:hypothetical protein